MINIISCPDIVDSVNKKVFLINVSFDVLHLVISFARTMKQDVDFYVTADQTTDAEWFSKVLTISDKIFKNPEFEIVHHYLKELDE